MKKFLLMCCVGLVMTGCDLQLRAPKEKHPYADAIAAHIADDIKNDTTILGFVFGASRVKTEQHIKELIDKDVLKETKNDDTYFYEFTPVTGHKAFGFLQTYYEDDKFHGFILDCPELKEHLLLEFVRTKYGAPDLNNSVDKLKNAVWFKDAAVISVYGLGLKGSVVSVKDIRNEYALLKQKREQDSLNFLESRQNHKKSLDEF